MASTIWPAADLLRLGRSINAWDVCPVCAKEARLHIWVDGVLRCPEAYADALRRSREEMEREAEREREALRRQREEQAADRRADERSQLRQLLVQRETELAKFKREMDALRKQATSDEATPVSGARRYFDE